MKKIIKWKNYLIIYAALLLALNLFLIKLPLTDVFGYEFSAVNAIAISFMAGIYVISLYKEKNDRPKPISVSVFANLSLLLFVPFLVSIINSVFTGFCSFTDGVLFYLVIAAPSILVGGVLGAISITLLKKFRLALFVLIFFVVLMSALSEIYFNPQVYLYNPIFGYFPGTIYDEGLSVDLKLLFYRLLNSVFFFGIFILIHNVIINRKTRTIAWRRISYSIVVALIFYLFISPRWGYSTTFSKLKDELPVKIDTEHFIIYADQTIEESKLKFIAINQEYFYESISEFLNEEFDEKINSYIFRSSQQKKTLFGSGNADVAKPWQRSVYVSIDSWENSLKHEIAHCFAGKFGWGIFEVAAGFNPALIEGVAEACDGLYDELDIHFLASIAYKNNYEINISKLFSGFSFFGNVSGLSYIYSGSFIKFLIEKYGIEYVKKYYKTNDFEGVFNKEISEVETEYKKLLNAHTENNWIASANYYFGRQPLIQKVCPRYISEQLVTAWDLLNKDKHARAEVYFKEVLSKTDNYSAIVGLSIISEKKDSLNSAIELLEEKIENFRGTSYEYNLMLRIADLEVQNGTINKAKRIYEKLKISRPSIRFDLLARMRLALMKNDQITDYVSGSNFDKYLLLKQLNQNSVNCSSIPIMIDLSETLDENYKLFLSGLKDYLEVEDFYSSYASLKLSQYMLQNFDFVNARKLAGLSLRFKDENRTLELKERNFQRAEWIYRNAERILENMKISRDRLL